MRDLVSLDDVPRPHFRHEAFHSNRETGDQCKPAFNVLDAWAVSPHSADPSEPAL